MKHNILKSHQDSTKEIFFSDEKRSDFRWSINQCTCSINGHIYTILDWSMSGIQIDTSNFPYKLQDSIDLILKFRLSISVLKIPCRAKVVRKNSNHVGLKFETTSKYRREELFRVVDYNVANEFALSQTMMINRENN